MKTEQELSELAKSWIGSANDFSNDPVEKRVLLHCAEKVLLILGDKGKRVRMDMDDIIKRYAGKVVERMEGRDLEEIVTDSICDRMKLMNEDEVVSEIKKSPYSYLLEW